MSDAESSPEPQGRPDVVVVGAGLAGLCAAWAAHRAGRAVVVVEHGGGASRQASGAIDVADAWHDAVPGPAFDPFTRGGTIVDAARALASRMPGHPWAILSAHVETFPARLAALAPLLDVVLRDDGRNHLVPTWLGTVKRTAAVSRTQLLDVLDLPVHSVVGVVDWRDLAGFSARAVADTLTWLASFGAHPVRFVPVHVPRIFDDVDVCTNARDFALRVQDDPVRCATALWQALLSTTEQTVTHLLTPPVLGAQHALDAATFDDLVGVPVRELLAFPPSPPAERMITRLRAALVERGVAFMRGRVARAHVRDGVCTGLEVEGALLSSTLQPASVVLASGRFFGGGLVRDQVARERIFGLPVVVDGDEVGDRHIGELLGEDVGARHAIFRAGLRVNEQLHPLDAQGRVALWNVCAAGSVIGGYDPARDGTAAGVACITGMLAGERAAEVAG